MEALSIPPQDSLAVLAERIARYAREADDRTLLAALLVREARARVDDGEAGAVTWYEWAPQNINLSESRLRELQRIAEAPDPAAELKRLREQARKRVENHRAKQRSAPLRNGDEAVREKVEPEPERTRLIDRLITWARKAPPQRISDVLAYIDRVDAAAESDSEMPAEQ